VRVEIRSNDLVNEAVGAGGTTYSESKDYGFMYQHSFQDPDGHIWELIYMEPRAKTKSKKCSERMPNSTD